MGLEPEMEETLKRYNTNMGLEIKWTPQKLTSLWYSYGDKNLRWQYLQKCIISTLATYVWHTCEKVKKKSISKQKMEVANNSE